jgi:hypothetical protein
MDRKIVPSLPDKEKFNRDLYFIPNTNRSSKLAKQLYNENWKIFEELINSMKLGHEIKLELARDFITEIKERNITDENLLNAMKRSFAARIGRQKRQVRSENNL